MLFWIFRTETFYEIIHAEVFSISVEVTHRHILKRLFHWYFRKIFPNMQSSCAVVATIFVEICVCALRESLSIDLHHASLKFRRRLHRCSYEKVFWKYAANLPKKTHTKVLLCNFIEIILRHGFSPVHLLYIFRIPFPKNSSGGSLHFILESKLLLHVTNTS